MAQLKLDSTHTTAKINLKGRKGAFNILVDQTSLFGAQRTDMGAPFDLTKPTNYRERVDVMWLAYDWDSGFKYLIDRLSHYGANGYTFFSKTKKETEFWNEWSSRINEGINTILPGLREVIKWNIKHLALGGLSFNNWMWGTMRIGKRDYQVPIKWNVHNQRSVVIARKGNGFSNEVVGIKVEKEWLKQGDTSWAEAYDITEATQFGKLGGASDMIATPKDKSSYFLMKFNTSMGDNTSDDSTPQAEKSAASLYPTPPFYSLLPVLKLRQQLRAMDLNIVDGFINKLVIWKIGDKDFPPLPDKVKADGTTQEGTIAQVKALITKENKGNVLQLFVPYWIDLDIRMPDINPLISTEKYHQPWMDMMGAFGLLSNPTGSNTEYTEINTQNFEQLVSFYREEHIEQMLEQVVFREIAKRNNLDIPELRFNPLNTVNNDFLRNIRELSGMGKISTDTLLRFHRLDKKFELPMVTDEITSSENKEEIAKMAEEDIFNTNTPIKFKQAVVSDTGSPEEPGKKTTVKSGTETSGRPIGKKDSVKREPKQK